MSITLDWQRVDPQETIVQALQQLASGQVVIFPTDTAYVVAASALVPEAVERLANLTPVEDTPPVELAVSGAVEALEWIPDMSVVAQRIARRCWPGPVILTFPASGERGPGQRLPPTVQDLVYRGGKLRLRCPCHPSLLHVLRFFTGPIALRTLTSAGGKEITASDQLLQQAGADLIIADGPTYFGKPASVVEMNGDDWHLIREGVVSAEDLQQLTYCQIIFVCTGNTCRSPMAEALCKKLLADQLACSPEELPARGYVVQSAGLSAMPGGAAAQEAVETAREMGADLTGHRSQPLTTELLVQADHVLTMTGGHLQALSGHGMNMILAPRLLSCDGEDVADPIGGEQEVYRACARQILEHLQRRLPEFGPRGTFEASR